MIIDDVVYFEVILAASTCWCWFCVWNVAMAAGNWFDESELEICCYRWDAEEWMLW